MHTTIIVNFAPVRFKYSDLYLRVATDKFLEQNLKTDKTAFAAPSAKLVVCRSCHRASTMVGNKMRGVSVKNFLLQLMFTQIFQSRVHLNPPHPFATLAKNRISTSMDYSTRCQVYRKLQVDLIYCTRFKNFDNLTVRIQSFIIRWQFCRMQCAIGNICLINNYVR